MQKFVLIALLAVACLCSVSIATSAPACQYDFQGGSSYDFSNIGTLTGVFNGQPAYMNLCNNIADKCKGTSSICSVGTSDEVSFAAKGGSAVPPINTYDQTTKISTIKEESGKAQCYSFGLQPRKLSIKITCGSKNSDTFEIIDMKSGCVFETAVTLKCGGESSGLSGGALFLIIFFSLFAAYFIIGFIVCKFVLKAQGTNAVPQFAFWSALPGFYIAGIKCLVGKITGGGKSRVTSSTSDGYGATEEDI